MRQLQPKEEPMRNIRVTGLAAVVMVIASLCQLAPAQQPAPKPAVDLGAFVKELMAIDFRDQRSHLAIWMPYEFFVAAVVNEGKMPKAIVEKDLHYMTPYVTVFVQSSMVQPDGADLYSDEKEVRARAFIRLPDGVEIAPLEKVPPTVGALLAALKVIISAEGDAGSANLHALVFPALTPKGQRVVDTLKQDKLILVLKANSKFKETSFTWRTPFDSLTTVPDCPRCKSGVSAKWSHCPYCGQKLPH